MAEFGFMKQLGDIGKGVEVFLELALGHQEQHHELDRLIVQGVETNALFGTAESADNLVNQVG